MVHPNIDPIALQLGPFAIRWYGLMYLAGFMAAFFLAQHRAKLRPKIISAEQCSDLIFYGACGVIIGGRLGYIFFYDLASVMDDPLRIFRVWEGGMSFHGGLIGVLTALALYAKKIQRGVMQIFDFVAPLIPIGLGLGRIGNFINGELWGKVSSVPWAMSPAVGLAPRHPTQLYEFFLEGVLLFIILWVFSAKERPTMSVSGLFMICYGVFRFLVEFVRMPDAHIGYLAWGWLTMGQILSIPMIILGVVWLIAAYRNHEQRAVVKQTK